MSRFKKREHKFPKEIEFLGLGDVLSGSYARNQSAIGIYFLIQGQTIVYVGQSMNMHRRVYEHHTDREKEFDRYFLYPCPQALLLRLEDHYIATFSPRYNVFVYGRSTLNAEQAMEAGKLAWDKGTNDRCP